MVGVLSVFFFFQAEDGIRDGRVTGVQTCALPISLGRCSVGVGVCSCSKRKSSTVFCIFGRSKSCSPTVESSSNVVGGGPEEMFKRRLKQESGFVGIPTGPDQNALTAAVWPRRWTHLACAARAALAVG